MRRHAKAKGSKKKTSGIAAAALEWLGLGLSVFLGWLVVLPDPRYSGRIGSVINGELSSAFGVMRYAIPVLALNLSWRQLAYGRKGQLISALASLVALASACAFIHVPSPNLGGSLGAYVGEILRGGLGAFGTSVLSLAVMLFALHILFGVRWGRLAARLFHLLADDVKQWRSARQELSRIKAAAPTIKAEAKPAVKAPEPVKEAPKPVIREAPKELVEKPRKAVGGGAAARVPAPAPADSPYADYQPPSLELLSPPPPAKDRGKPTEEEIRSAVSSLETTLKNFGIEAHVTGYAPGPVITRYELSPAPGVKVSSIVALENDIALAMKAKGIRIIAPIPGKAAVGIEIPNPRQASVVLREILQSDAIAASAPLLTFALGLSSSGEPVSADIAKMPHVLVAGATGSGKSVLIHSMVLSILFRARPDEVKLMLIDPKRTELTFYESIPHLFDPTTDPARVSVITNAKDASKSLKALVSLMEKRYEKLQLFGVRNIEGYNAEADKKGQPREFYIVVVIDELADLMLIAGDVVEDAIQRLTQMARAVGIHLVLATQRPSVDVITGVIKANLPSRIALQVISKIDSKVILDGSGAEALQGRGDLLYLATGAQKPERCQGAFVSEEEIRSVVSHLKAQGEPSYPMLETMAAKSSAADDLAQFGVEPLEFSQALKLVLERRRVSQDLLKSQFGSSARATNLLSALEVKELIHKPEGSNRWEIHFDQIEDYLRQYFPQVPIDQRR